jgi:hypothetical protein
MNYYKQTNQPESSKPKTAEASKTQKPNHPQNQAKNEL